MSSETEPTVDQWLNSPWINAITGYVGHLQERKLLTKQRLQSFRHYALLTIGFFVLIYFLIHIQILVYWLLKFLFGLIFKFISVIFWLPLKTARFFIPRTIDYDVLFPLFWLCSIASFYSSKHFHEQICQFYDRELVRRYRALRYDPNKRDEIRRYLFILTFIVLLLFQSLFILFPIAQSIKHHHAEARASSISSTVKPMVSRTTTAQTPMAKSAVKEAVKTMRANLYERFVEAFKDENETLTQEKKKPLISDEQLEKTFEAIQKTIRPGTKKTKEEEPKVERTSRFQRWVLHYLKAPFQKWPPPKEETPSSEVLVDENELQEEESEDELEDMPASSSHLMSEIEDSDEESEEEEAQIDEDTEEHPTIPQRIQQSLNKVKDFGKKIKNQISSSDDDEDEEEDDEPDDEDDDEPAESSSIKETLSKRLKQVKTMGEEVAKKFTSSKHADDDEQVSSIPQGIKETVTKQVENLHDQAEAVGRRLSEQLSSKQPIEKSQASKITHKIEETLSKPMEAAKTLADHVQEKISSLTHHEEEKEPESLTDRLKHFGERVAEGFQHRFSSSKSKDDEESGYESDNESDDDASVMDRVQEKVLKPMEEKAEQLRDKFSTLVETEKKAAKRLIDRTQHATEKLAKPLRGKIVSEADHIHHVAENLVDAAEDAAIDAYEKSAEFLKGKAHQIKRKLPKAEKVLSNVKHDVLEPIEKKVKQTTKVLKKKTGEVKEALVTGVQSLKKKKKPKTLPEKAKDQLRKLKEKLPGQKKKKKTTTEKYAKLLRETQSKLRQGTVTKLNGWLDDAWNVWHLTVKNLAHLFTPSTKHARHLPRYNTTSIYTAYTDLKCYDYTKKRQLYRIAKHPHLSLLDAYRAHSPFPVYLSVLKSNGPRCYRQYPDSSCGVTLKMAKRSFLTQLYRFFRFWIILGIVLAVGAALYQRFVEENVQHRSPHGDSDRSGTGRISTTSTKGTSSSSPTRSEKRISFGPTTSSPTTRTVPFNEQVHEQLRLWLHRQMNDGYQKLSETCRVAMNNTFQKQLVSRVSAKKD